MPTSSMYVIAGSASRNSAASTESAEGSPGTAWTAGPSTAPTTSVATRCTVPPRKLVGANLGSRSATQAAMAAAPATNSSKKVSFPIPTSKYLANAPTPHRRKDSPY
jgi:hypothetical protein